MNACRPTTHVSAWVSISEVYSRRGPTFATVRLTSPRCTSKAEKFQSYMWTVLTLADDFRSSSLSSVRTVRLIPRNALLFLFDLVDFPGWSDSGAICACNTDICTCMALNCFSFFNSPLMRHSFSWAFLRSDRRFYYLVVW